MQKKIYKLSNALLLTFIVISVCFFAISKYSKNDWSRSIASDGKGYYIYLPATFIYNDFSYRFDQVIEANYYGADIQSALSIDNKGRKVNKYYIGTSLLITPFFLIAWFLASYILDFPPDGYSAPFNAAVSIAAVFYALLGLFFILRICTFYKFSESIKALLITALFFGTNLLYYTWLEPSMSHVYSFFAFSFFIYKLKKQQFNYSQSGLLFLFLLLSLIIVIRPINSLIVVFIPFLLGSWGSLKAFFYQQLKHPFVLILGLILFSFPIFLQLITYHLQTGEWFIWSYGNEGFNFKNSNIFNILFSFRKGWFIYTPFMFLCLITTILLIKQLPYFSLSFLTGFITVVYVLSCWHQWFYGGSYSCRALIEYSAIMVIPLGQFITLTRKIVIKTCIVFVSSCFILLNLIQIYQYQSAILRYDNMNWKIYRKIFLAIGSQYYFKDEKDKLLAIPLDYKLVYNTFNDFEKVSDWDNLNTVNTEKYYSGTHSSMAYKKMEYSASFNKPFDLLYPQTKSHQLFIAEVSLMAYKESNCTVASLVLTCENGSELILFEGKYLNPLIEDSDIWQKITLRYQLPEIDNKHTHLKLFVGSNDRTKVFVDDISIKLYAKNE